MKNIIKYVQRIFENLLIQMITILIITSGVLYVFRDKIFSVGSQFIPVWSVFLFLTLIFVVRYLIQHLRMKRLISSAAVGRRRGTIHETEIPCTLYGVKWIAYVPNQYSHMLTRDEYVRVTGPFCPKCCLELIWEEGFLGIRYYWLCERCDERYARPRKKRYDMIKHVENICHSDIFRKNKFKRGNHV